MNNNCEKPSPSERKKMNKSEEKLSKTCEMPSLSTCMYQITYIGSLRREIREYNNVLNKR
jgi:hypothetical protein